MDMAQASPQIDSARIIDQNASAIAPATSASSDSQAEPKKGITGALRFILRPFRRFTILWCFLLLVTTHTAIVWLCLFVVLVRLARKIFIILKILLLSDPFLKKLGAAVFSGLNNALVALAVVTTDAAPTSELKNLWNQLTFWRKPLNFLKDPYLVSRRAWVLGILFFGSIYIYIAFLFSFAYFGIARIAGVHYSWPDALISSVFIPFFISELPKILAVKLLGGIHCVLVLAVGIGTVINFLRRKLDAIRKAATDYSNRLADDSIQEKYSILEQKFSTTNSAPPAKNIET